MTQRSPGWTQAEAARRAGVRDERVLAALAAVPRDRFVPPAAHADADSDRPLRIGEGQTTSQPSLVAGMLEALELTGSERVLEVGAGSGYQATILSHLAAEVVTIERHASLAGEARQNLDACGRSNVEVVVGDGTRGAPGAGPFDAVIVAAASASVPRALVEQLRNGGRLVAPIGGPGTQRVVVHERDGGTLRVVAELSAVRFVPLVPDAG
ncbi:MAG: protein-L-isoaspartate(D-aspartate) O-methyltransferase [Nitriliruptor sp.]